MSGRAARSAEGDEPERGLDRRRAADRQGIRSEPAVSVPRGRRHLSVRCERRGSKPPPIRPPSRSSAGVADLVGRPTAGRKIFFFFFFLKKKKETREFCVAGAPASHPSARAAASHASPRGAPGVIECASPSWLCVPSRSPMRSMARVGQLAGGKGMCHERRRGFLDSGVRRVARHGDDARRSSSGAAAGLRQCAPRLRQRDTELTDLPFREVAHHARGALGPARPARP